MESTDLDVFTVSICQTLTLFLPFQSFMTSTCHVKPFDVNLSPLKFLIHIECYYHWLRVKNASAFHMENDIVDVHNFDQATILYRIVSWSLRYIFYHVGIGTNISRLIHKLHNSFFDDCFCQQFWYLLKSNYMYMNHIYFIDRPSSSLCIWWKKFLRHRKPWCHNWLSIRYGRLNERRW